MTFNIIQSGRYQTSTNSINGDWELTVTIGDHLLQSVAYVPADPNAGESWGCSNPGPWHDHRYLSRD